MYCVYIHTNLINGKVYVGQTVHGDNPEKRWGNNGQGYSKNSEFYKDIEKFGWNKGFRHDILENGLTLEEANKKEKYYISLFNATDKKFGYNKTKGGGNSNRKVNVKERLAFLDYTLKLNSCKRIIGYNDSQGILRTYPSKEEK